MAQPFVSLSRCAVLIAAFFLFSACRGRESSSNAASDTLSPMLERRTDGSVIASAESLRKIPGYVVDSIFPPAEALRRFRVSSGSVRPTTLTEGDTSIRALFTGYVAALAARDSAAVLRFALTRAEYAWLYYDGSPEQQSGLVPQAAWPIAESRSNVGLGRAADRVSSLGNARVLTATCGPTKVVLPAAELDGPCTVVLESSGGKRTTLQISRMVIQRDGRVKLVSFANDL
jgi:hypothetical protein